jgi:hypothetical protein
MHITEPNSVDIYLPVFYLYLAGFSAPMDSLYSTSWTPE